jgi:hypothetical protein
MSAVMRVPAALAASILAMNGSSLFQLARPLSFMW